MIFERHALETLPPGRARKSGRILCYHSVDDAEMGINDVGAKQLRRQIEFALERGHRFVKASDIAIHGGDPKDVAITYDDGRKSVMAHAAHILAEYNIPWTFFIVTTWTDQAQAGSAPQFVSWTDIESLMRADVEIGSHTRTHPDFGKIGRAQMVDELAGSRLEFQRRLGFCPTSFAIPLGQSMNWTQEAGAIAREAGYELVYAQAEETRPRDTIPRTFVTRFDDRRIFSALLKGAYDRWEEWV
jgi:peptidoglycan/xylan/chitin deacetylase (PgdA/CDA1 family)